MNSLSPQQLLWAHWPWGLAGTLVGLGLVPLARFIPRNVLQNAQAPLHEWQGPGGGLEHPVPPARRIWVPILNACLWTIAAGTTPLQPFWAPLPAATLACSLLLLAIIDWDTTKLPDRVVLPLGFAGLCSSYAGLTRHSLIATVASAALLWGLLAQQPADRTAAHAYHDAPSPTPTLVSHGTPMQVATALSAINLPVQK